MADPAIEKWSKFSVQPSHALTRIASVVATDSRRHTPVIRCRRIRPPERRCYWALLVTCDGGKNLWYALAQAIPEDLNANRK